MIARLYTNPTGTQFMQVAGPPTLSQQIARDDNDPSYWLNIRRVLRNPDPVLQQTGEAADLYEELLYDPQVGSAVESRQAGTLGQLWYINRENVDDADPISKVAADTIEAHFATRLAKGAEDNTTHMLDTPLFGHRVLEVIWEVVKTETGLWWLPVRLEEVPYHRIAFTTDGEFRLRTRENPDGEEVPKYKFLVLRHRPRKGNQYGMALLARCWWPVQFKKSITFWVRYIEKYGMPWALIKYRQGLDQAEIDKIVNTIDAAIQDAVIAVPNTTEAEIHEPPAASSQIFRELLDWCDQQISKGILGHTGTSDATPGKLGSEEAAIGVLDARVQKDCRTVRAGYNELIEWMYEVNWNTPHRVTYDLYKAADVAMEVASRDQVVASMGYEFSDDYMQRTYSYKPGDIRRKTATEPPAGSGLLGGAAFAAAETIPPPPDQQAIDAAADAITPESQQSIMESITKSIMDLVHAGGSPDAMLKKLETMFPKVNTEKLETALADAIFMAEAIGRISVNGEAD